MDFLKQFFGGTENIIGFIESMNGPSNPLWIYKFIICFTKPIIGLTESTSEFTKFIIGGLKIQLVSIYPSLSNTENIIGFIEPKLFFFNHVSGWKCQSRQLSRSIKTKAFT